MSLTKSQKEMLQVLDEYRTVTTDPPSRKHNTMLALVRKGYAEESERYGNVFLSKKKP
jgi:hypothetical protein